jgi:hypothetical protein
MLKRFRDKIAVSGIAVLLVGVGLLIFTFISAFGFLTQSLPIIATQDLVETFGGALAPLIATSIRIMYLGVMGWIGSLLTIRGVTIIAHAPRMPTIVPQKLEENVQSQPVQNLKDQKLQKSAEGKQSTLEFRVIPPQEVAEPVQQNQEKNEKRQ